MQDFNPHDPHGLNAMRFEIRETLSALDEGMLKKIIEIINAPVTFEFHDYYRGTKVKVTIIEGQVTWYVEGTIWRGGKKPRINATLKGLTLLELCDSNIGRDLFLDYDEIVRQLGWNDWCEGFYGLPPHAHDAIHRITA